MTKVTTKACWNCGCTRLREYSSKNEKHCDECLSIMPWHVEQSQKPTVGPSRDRDTLEREDNHNGY